MGFFSKIYDVVADFILLFICFVVVVPDVQLVRDGETIHFTDLGSHESLRDRVCGVCEFVTRSPLISVLAYKLRPLPARLQLTLLRT